MPNLQKVRTTRMKDFAPVSLIALTPFAWSRTLLFGRDTRRSSSPLLRANPDHYALFLSGTGATAHLIVELFNSMAQIKARQYPQGSSPAAHRRDHGQIAYTLETVTATLAHVKSDAQDLRRQLRHPQRRDADVPPLAEAQTCAVSTSALVGYAAPSRHARRDRGAPAEGNPENLAGKDLQSFRHPGSTRCGHPER